MENYLTKKYDFRLNKISSMVQFKLKKDTQYNNMSDVDYNSLQRELDQHGIKCNMSLIRNTLNSDYSKEFDPFKTYFDNLPKWDGTDHIQLLAKTVETTTDETWQRWFKKWLVSMVACLTLNDKVNHSSIVFSGKQGIGKTTWLLNLVPDMLSEYCFSGTLNLSNKDSQILLNSCMLIILDELENMKPNKMGELKEYLTKGQIKIRRPYGHSDEILVRRASFAGSINTEEFLNDTTGSRRFLCFQALDFDYNHNVNLDQVYSQSLHLLNTGFKYWFDPEDVQEIEDHNSKFKQTTIEENLLLKHFSPINKGMGRVLSTSQILEELRDRESISYSNSSLNLLGKALKANGFERHKHKGKYVYSVKDNLFV